MSEKPFKVTKTNRVFKATPKDLRDLPADWVTHDAADKNRIHPVDFPHIRKGLARQRLREIIAKEPPLKLAWAMYRIYFDERALDNHYLDVLDQERVDLWRGRIILATAMRPVINDELRHIWFPGNSAKSMELREGPPPARSERPKHLKNLALEIQVLDWNARMRDIVKQAGFEPHKLLEEINEKIIRQKAERISLKDFIKEG